VGPQAVQHGRWVLLDNLHLAPIEVTTLLDTLVSSRTLHVAQRDDLITAHPSFRLFATVQTPEGGPARPLVGPLATLNIDDWWHIHLPVALRADRVSVLSGRFPEAAALVLPVMALAEVVHVAATPPQNLTEALIASPTDVCATVWAEWQHAVRSCLADAHIAPGECTLSLPKQLGMHDLVKMLSRVTLLHRSLLAPGLARLSRGADVVATSDVLAMSFELRCAVLGEAADVLCGFAVGQVRPVMGIWSNSPQYFINVGCGYTFLIPLVHVCSYTVVSRILNMWHGSDACGCCCHACCCVEVRDLKLWWAAIPTGLGMGFGLGVHAAASFCHLSGACHVFNTSTVNDRCARCPAAH
jgi:hypothetical protein